MITRQGNRLLVEGSITTLNMRQAMQEGIAEIENGATLVDMGGLENVDSSAISMMLEWQRRARSRKLQLRFCNLTDGLKSLAKLYGVIEMIPQD